MKIYITIVFFLFVSCNSFGQLNSDKWKECWEESKYKWANYTDLMTNDGYRRIESRILRYGIYNGDSPLSIIVRISKGREIEWYIQFAIHLHRIVLTGKEKVYFYRSGGEEPFLSLQTISKTKRLINEHGIIATYAITEEQINMLSANNINKIVFETRDGDFIPDKILKKYNQKVKEQYDFINNIASQECTHKRRMKYVFEDNLLSE